MTFRTTTTLMLALAAGLVAGCGGDDEPEGDPIPQQAAADIESRLAEVERRMEAGGGACADIQNDTKPAVDSIVASLPSGVDADVRNGLQESVDRLFQLTEQRCDEQKGEDTDSEAEPPPPDTETDTDTTETVPPPEEEEGDEGEEQPPTTETPTDEVPPETPPEADPDQGNGGGALVPGEDE